MTDAILIADGVTRRFGGLIAVNSISFELQRGQILGIIGPNGAGKSTLFSLLSGSLRPTAGHVRLKGKDITGLSAHTVCRRGLARTYQIPRPFSDLTVHDNIRVARHYGGRGKATRSVHDILVFCELASKADALPDSLTHADLRRLEFARALATGPDVILLDELGAGLSEGEISLFGDLIRQVRDWGLSVVLVEHVLSLVMTISHRVLVMDTGKKIAEDTPNEVTRDPEVIAAYLGRSRNEA